MGVVMVKRPGNNILLEPTVLGELLDQMLLVEGFYGMGPLIGILTTAEEWVVSWFPLDSATLARAGTARSDAEFTTLLKSTAVATINESTSVNTYNPLEDTFSQKTGSVHNIEVAAADPTDSDDNNNNNTVISTQMERLLATTKVMNINTQYDEVIQLLCSASQLMANSCTYYHANISRCLFKFHKDMFAVTFHPATHEEIYPMVNFNKFPNKTVKTLVALEDLGRGSSGKGWLCASITQSHSAACVLKFDNEDASSFTLNHEKEMWHLLYPEFSHMVEVEHWSGADALVMPHFSKVLEQEREQYRDEVRKVLNEKFVKNRKVHQDVHWRNIGKYKVGEKVVIVVFDLNSLVDDNATTYSGWVDNAIISLYKPKSVKCEQF